MRFSEKAKGYLVTKRFNDVLSSLHYFPQLLWKGAAGGRAMTPKFASVISQALHPMHSKNEPCPRHNSNYSREATSSWAPDAALGLKHTERRGLLLFALQLFAGQERGRVRYVAGKARTGNCKWEPSRKNKHRSRLWKRKQEMWKICTSTDVRVQYWKAEPH